MSRRLFGRLIIFTFSVVLVSAGMDASGQFAFLWPVLGAISAIFCVVIMAGYVGIAWRCHRLFASAYPAYLAVATDLLDHLFWLLTTACVAGYLIPFVDYFFHIEIMKLCALSMHATATWTFFGSLAYRRISLPLRRNPEDIATIPPHLAITPVPAVDDEHQAMYLRFVQPAVTREEADG